MKTAPAGQMPTISIITVCRNSASSIDKTIESVLAQKDPGVEYIIVDGASTDGTQEIVRSYQSIDHFISEPDQGIADAFNKGIQLASGDIIGLINSDDQLRPSALSAVRRCFLSNPDVAVIHGDVLLHRGNRVVKLIKPSSRWWYPWRLVLFNHPSTFVRSDIYKSYGLYDLNYRIAMDVEIFLRWTDAGVTIRYLPEILVNMQADGLSGQQAMNGFKEVRRAALQHGFHPFLVQMQFAGKCVLWFLLQFFSRYKSRYVRESVTTS